MSQSWNWPGSRWWRVDLHCHSSASHDYKGEPDDWTGWLKVARDRGIQALAITDHNTADGIQPLQNAAKEVEAAPVIFPGVELTTSDGTHLLLLMDPDCDHQHIESLLTRTEVPVDKRGDRNARSPVSVEKILSEFGDDVLVIGAHVNGESGLLEHTGQQRIAELNHLNLAAVEFKPDEENQDRSWIDGSRTEIGRMLPEIYNSDSHRPNRIGHRFTWIKMKQPNLEGLRLALLDGNDSLKPDDGSERCNPNNYPDMAIESITIQGGKYIGRASPLEVKFNPWLNAIIGGRGTGKSTIIDFCRKTMRQETELDNIGNDTDGSIKSLYDNRMQVPADRNAEGLLTPDTSIRMIYRMDDTRFAISWSHDSNVRPVIRLDGQTEITEEGSNIQKRFPVRIYSQKQLFQIAQNPDALLTIVDSSEEVNGHDFQHRIKELRYQYLALRAEARSIMQQAKDLPDQRADLTDKQRKLESWQRGGQTQIINDYKKRRQYHSSWEDIVKLSVQSIENLENSVQELSVANLDSNSGMETIVEGHHLIRMHQDLTNAVDNLRSKVSELIEQVNSDINKINSSHAALQWKEALNNSYQEFQKASEQLASMGLSDPSKYTTLMSEIENSKQKIKTMEEKLKKANHLEQNALKILSEYRTTRQELSERRQSFLEKNVGKNLRIDILPFNKTDSLSEEISNQLGIEDRFERDRIYMIGKMLPTENSIWNWGHWDRYDEVVKRLEKFIDDESKLPWEARDHRFEAALKRVTNERLDRLFLYLPDDELKVSFKDQNNSNWRPLEQGSPGQQTAALLAFVLSQGSEPIIFDQPEDDLDNTLIYNLLVNQIREAKPLRQIIVVTHNPNIVVHGDAELVISLEVKGGQSHITCSGGLQESRIREEICRVMEGGEEAFKTRFRRIMPPQGMGT